MGTNFLFTYGTLLSVFDTPLTKRLKQESARVYNAWCPGQLIDLGLYPALLPVQDGDQWVQGQLYELFEPAQTWEWLDEYEGLNESPPLYERAITPVRTDQKVLLSAWVYWRKENRANYPKIEEDYYPTFAAQSTKHQSFIQHLLLKP